MSKSPVPLMLLAASLALPLAKVHAGCDKCQRPRVIQFDSKILPPRPSDTTDPQLATKILEWRNLFWVSAGIKGHLFGGDPTRDCYTHLDGSFFTSGDTVSSGISFGEEWSNLPPSSGQAGGDYLVTGVVDGANGSYVLQAQLQVSKTREVVASSSKAFTSADEPMNVGKDAAMALGPIVDKIRAFEKSKRASGDPYALWPTAELHPKKTELEEGESVEVELWLYDCDGDIATSPLPDRPVQITATNGTVSEALVTTGADGKATFTFTAGSKSAEALLTATYPYTLASEHTSVGHLGQAAIKIREIPSTLWKVEGLVINQSTYTETKRSNYANISEGGNSNQSIYEFYAVNGVIDNVSKDAAIPFKGDTASLQVNIAGSHSEDQISRGYFKTPDYWSKNQSYGTVFCLPVPSTENPRKISFDYFPLPGTQAKAGGGFSLSNIEIKGTSKSYVKECDSEDGCSEDSKDGEASDLIDIHIPVPESLSGDRYDSSYTSMDGVVIVEHERSNITYEDGIFTVEYLYSDRKVKIGEGTVANTGYTSTVDRNYTFTISPVNHDGKSTRVVPGMRPATKEFLDARVLLDDDGVRVDFFAPSNGSLGVKVFDPNGRVVSRGVRRIGAGTRSERFSVPDFKGRILVAELVYSPANGNRPACAKRLVKLLNTRD